MAAEQKKGSPTSNMQSRSEHKFKHSHTYSPHHHVRSLQEAKYAKNGKNTTDIRSTKLLAKAVRDSAINALYAFLSPGQPEEKCCAGGTRKHFPVESCLPARDIVNEILNGCTKLARNGIPCGEKFPDGCGSSQHRTK